MDTIRLSSVQQKVWHVRLEIFDANGTVKEVEVFETLDPEALEVFETLDPEALEEKLKEIGYVGVL